MFVGTVFVLSRPLLIYRESLRATRLSGPCRNLSGFLRSGCQFQLVPPLIRGWVVAGYIHMAISIQRVQAQIATVVAELAAERSRLAMQWFIDFLNVVSSANPYCSAS